ncbi:tagaturonate epimerase family protein [Paenibacillus sp. YN15]|uniref:tagaturonate epimerase family protein n=1 Tax=Paenibacillus sp. YN15 TaxID=1742774 RepID=UPI0026C1640A
MGVYARAMEGLKKGETTGDWGVKSYPGSYTTLDGAALLMVKHGDEKFILAAGEGAFYEELNGREEDGGKICPLTHENRLVLNKYLLYTVPRAFGTGISTIGLGDRLGLASPGHIQTVRGRDIRPILAQQSIRELTLTGRDYNQVVDAACFAVFQEGYKDGFGADGDHLKVEADIKMSLDMGFTMLTLDCSEKIDNTIEGLSDEELAAKYLTVPEERRSYYEKKYLDLEFEAKEHRLTFDKKSLMKNVLIYGEAIEFMVHIYVTYIVNAGRVVDFEISIDETETPTDPASHYLVAKELYDREVSIHSMAPRFCGEFQKGIDYIGDLEQFEKELEVHAAIADQFGYKLSIHSGSDKFSVFPLVAKHTTGRFHVKTAGTNWLEAVRIVAKFNPQLYRRMHAYALEHFLEAKAYYHVTTDIAAIKPLDQTGDSDLHTYMDDNNARQLLHITYGLLLQAKDEAGEPLFKTEFFHTLSEHEDQYDAALAAHIGKHLRLLNK